MNPNFKDQTIELVKITIVDPTGEVKGEIISHNKSRNDTYKKIVRFNNPPPVSVGNKILARVVDEYDPETNVTLTIVLEYKEFLGSSFLNTEAALPQV